MLACGQGIIAERVCPDGYDERTKMAIDMKEIMGLLRSWTAEDTKNLDTIVHEVYLIMMGKIAPGEK